MWNLNLKTEWPYCKMGTVEDENLREGKYEKTG
jgi:hypothetical protein